MGIGIGVLGVGLALLSIGLYSKKVAASGGVVDSTFGNMFSFVLIPVGGIVSAIGVIILIIYQLLFS